MVDDFELALGVEIVVRDEKHLEIFSGKPNQSEPPQRVVCRSRQ